MTKNSRARSQPRDLYQTRSLRLPRHPSGSWALCALLIALLSACGGSNSEGSGDDEDDDGSSAIVLSLPIERIYLAPGDSFAMEITARSRTGDEPNLSLAYVEPSPPGPVVRPNDTEVRVDTDIIADRSYLRVRTSLTTEPGSYRIDVRASVFDDEQIRGVEVVVVPSELAARSEGIVDIAGGVSHTLALDEDGDVFAWGLNDWGQLGDGTLVDRALPVQVVGLPRPAVAVAAGEKHSLALLDDGRVAAWGRNEDRQVLPSSRTSPEDDRRSLPVIVTYRTAGEDELVDDIVAIAAGRRHSLALRSDGLIEAWGDNARGALGGGDEDSRHVIVDLPVVDAVMVAAGNNYSLALADDGSAWGWGRTVSGAIGADIGDDDRFAPIDIGFVPDIDAIGAGGNHSLLVLDDGNVGSLGDNRYGQLGDGSRSRPFGPPFRPPFLLNVDATDGGSIHSLALQANREVYAWGNNGFGQVGEDGPLTSDAQGRRDQLVPVRISAVPPSAGIAAGTRHSLSIADFCGQLWAWGEDSEGQLGVGAVLPRGGFRLTPRPVIGIGEVGLPTGCPVTLSIVQRGEGTVSASGTPIDGATCADEPCAERVQLDTVVDLSATPAEGHEFVRWGGQCDDDQPDTAVVMDGGKNCLAHFNALPVADFVAEDEPVVYPSVLGVDFDPGASTDADGEIVLYQFDLDDDGLFDVSDTRPYDRYEWFPPGAGVFPIRLVVTDDHGATAELIRMIEVVDRVRARIIESPESVRVGDNARFRAEEMPNYVSYTWDLDGDGQFDDATGPVVDHVFGAAGDVVVALSVRRDDGQVATTSRVVEVLPEVGGMVTLTIRPMGEGNGTVLNYDESFLCNFFGETSDPNPCVRTVPVGTTESLVAFASAGSFFSHWEIGECDEMPPGDPNPDCILTLDEDRTLDVYFE